MADSGSEDESAPQIELKFKTIQDTYEMRVNEKANIEKIKKQISKKINEPVEKICLIFSGKILKDHETLDQHKIVDGMVIHMVVKNVKSQQSPQSRESTPSSASSSIPPVPNVETAPAAAGIGGGGMGAMLNNPMVREMLNSPFMENLLSNPNVSDMMRQMLDQNPQFQQVVQNNPELGHVLNDPRIMQQTLEMIRNPNMFNELMRNHDQAIRNIQGIPGGEAALHRLYQDVQEPLMNSVLGAPGSGGQYAPNENNANNQQQASRSQHAGVENAEALPNPWSRVVNQQQPGQGQGTTNAGAEGGGLPFTPGMMNTPGMQSLMRQIFSNQAAVQSLFTPDNMRNFGQMMGNPALADQFRTTLGNPQIMQAMGNPRVMNAIMQLQQALRVLNEEMPGVFPNMPGAEIFQNMGIGGMAGLFGANANQQPDGNQAAANANGGNQPTEGVGAAPNAGQPPNMAPPAGLPELLGSIALMNLGNANAGAGGGAPAQPPEERYRSQLEQLISMGFTDQQANIQALVVSFGDVNLAIERLLNPGPGGVGGGRAGAGGGTE